MKRGHWPKLSPTFGAQEVPSTKLPRSLQAKRFNAATDEKRDGWIQLTQPGPSQMNHRPEWDVKTQGGHGETSPEMKSRAEGPTARVRWRGWTPIGAEGAPWWRQPLTNEAGRTMTTTRCTLPQRPGPPHPTPICAPQPTAWAAMWQAPLLPPNAPSATRTRNASLSLTADAQRQESRTPSFDPSHQLVRPPPPHTQPSLVSCLLRSNLIDHSVTRPWVHRSGYHWLSPLL